MFEFDPLDMDGDVDGIDFLGFDYLIQHLLAPEDEASDEVKEEDHLLDDEIPWWCQKACSQDNLARYGRYHR